MIYIIYNFEITTVVFLRSKSIALLAFLELSKNTQLDIKTSVAKFQQLLSNQDNSGVNSSEKEEDVSHVSTSRVLSIRRGRSRRKDRREGARSLRLGRTPDRTCVTVHNRVPTAADVGVACVLLNRCVCD